MLNHKLNNNHFIQFIRLLALNHGRNALKYGIIRRCPISTSACHHKLRYRFKDSLYESEWYKQREFQNLSVDMFQELIKSEEDAEQIEHVIKLYDDLKLKGKLKIPTTIPVNVMEELYKVNDRSKQKHELHHWYIKELNKVKKSQLDLKQQEDIDRRREERTNELLGHVGATFDEDDNPIYGLWQNAMFIRQGGSKLNKTLAYKMKNAALFGQKLIFDLGYEGVMNPKYLGMIADEISLSVRANRLSIDPFHVYICNAKHGSPMNQRIEQLVHGLYEPHHFIHITEKSYTDLFPKDQLIYLSPHSENVLEHYDGSVNYIIGCVAVPGLGQPFSQQRADLDGIKTAKFPIDQHVSNYLLKRHLQVDHVTKILLHAKTTNNWRNAFIKVIPKTRFKEPDGVFKRIFNGILFIWRPLRKTVRMYWRKSVYHVLETLNLNRKIK